MEVLGSCWSLVWLWGFNQMFSTLLSLDSFLKGVLFLGLQSSYCWDTHTHIP